MPAFAETLTPTFIGHSITAHDGAFVEKETDLKILGRGMDYEFTRTYRSRIEYDGPLGYGWDHNYNKRLVFQENGNVARFDGQARFDIYVKQTDGPSTLRQAQGERNAGGTGYESPSGYFDTLVVVKDAAEKITGATIKDKNGTVNTYGADGFITDIKDRNGNAMTFEYTPLLCKEGQGEVEPCKQLAKVTDTVGRAIEYTYNPSGKLSEIKDFSDRTVQFNYSQQGDLISATNPAGHTTRYTYSSGFGDDRSELNHNLLTVTDAKGQTYLKNIYSIYDRVTKQTFGDEGNFLIEYNQVASSLECTDDLKDKIFYRTNVTDRKGNKLDYLFNCQGNPLEVKLAGLSTKYVYNKDGLVTKVTRPKGDATDYSYDAKGNILSVTKLPETGSSDAPIETKFEYDAQFGRLTKLTDAAGHIITFTLDAKGNVTGKCQGEICESYTYTAAGQLESITDGEGNTDSYTYNDKGYLGRIVRDSGSVKGSVKGHKGVKSLLFTFAVLM